MVGSGTLAADSCRAGVPIAWRLAALPQFFVSPGTRVCALCPSVAEAGRLSGGKYAATRCEVAGGASNQGSSSSRSTPTSQPDGSSAGKCIPLCTSQAAPGRELACGRFGEDSCEYQSASPKATARACALESSALQVLDRCIESYPQERSRWAACSTVLAEQA